jgi:hypothetical protein
MKPWHPVLSVTPSAFKGLSTCACFLPRPHYFLPAHLREMPPVGCLRMGHDAAYRMITVRPKGVTHTRTGLTRSLRILR